MIFDWSFTVTYRVYKKGISSCIQGHFYFGRTHLSECISAAWQCVGWTISKMKYKVHFSLTSSPLLKGERRKNGLNNRKVEKRVWKMNCRHFRSRWASILAVSWNHWGVKGEKDGWNIKYVSTYNFVFLFFFFKWVWTFLIIYLLSRKK